MTEHVIPHCGGVEQLISVSSSQHLTPVILLQRRDMARVSKVEGYDAFKAKISELASAGGDIFVMFSGSKDASGVSWCPDCVTAEPVVTVR